MSAKIINTIATQLGGRITLVNRAEGGPRATLSITDGQPRPASQRSTREPPQS
ncbi:MULTISPECIES: hypothetical protein [Pseudomonas]|uniref:hypothetical protein n=1 Tax=Pseudomonas TaxID=286 RepID=UPI001FE31613|nr:MULTISPECIES: hypothetical protein [Pseudomonas]